MYQVHLSPSAYSSTHSAKSTPGGKTFPPKLDPKSLKGVYSPLETSGTFGVKGHVTEKMHVFLAVFIAPLPFILYFLFTVSPTEFTVY